MSNRIMRVSHFEECENQPEDRPCICDKIKEQLDEAQVDALLDDYISEK